MMFSMSIMVLSTLLPFFCQYSTSVSQPISMILRPVPPATAPSRAGNSGGTSTRGGMIAPPQPLPAGSTSWSRYTA